MSAAGWYADPYGQGELRYWDGVQWTQQVATSGVAHVEHQLNPVLVVAPELVSQRRGSQTKQVAIVVAALVFVAVGGFLWASAGDSNTEGTLADDSTAAVATAFPPVITTGAATATTITATTVETPASTSIVAIPVATTPVVTDPPVELGVSAELVQLAQQYLNRLYYGPLEEDGEAGPATAASVRRFQSDHGLTATGVLDEVTFAAVESGAGDVTFVATNCDQGLVNRPVVWNIDCSPAFWIEELVWTSWGPNGAVGTGVWVSRICEPSCIESTDVSYDPMSIELSRPAAGSCGDFTFTDVVVVYDADQYRFEWVLDPYVRDCGD